MATTRALRRVLAVAALAALATTGTLAFAKSNKLSGDMLNDPDGKVSMKVVLNDKGKPKLIKDISVTLTYTCADENGNVRSEEVIRQDLPWKIRKYEPPYPGRPYYFTKTGKKVDGRFWGFTAEVNKKGTKAFGNATVQGGTAGGPHDPALGCGNDDGRYNAKK
jgi:hypothetical protein